jgi:hypothetical protein
MTDGNLATFSYFMPWANSTTNMITFSDGSAHYSVAWSDRRNNKNDIFDLSDAIRESQAPISAVVPVDH